MKQFIYTKSYFLGDVHNEKVINAIETFIERYTPHTQIIIFFLLNIWNLFSCHWLNTQVIIISLAILIGLEMHF